MYNSLFLSPTSWLLLALVFLIGLLCGAFPIRALLKRVSQQRAPDLSLYAREAIGVLQTFYEHAPTLVGVVELIGTDVLHVYDNPGACRFLGVLPGQTEGRLESEIGVPPEQTAAWLARYQQSLERRSPVRFEFHAGDGRWFAVTVCPVIERLPTKQQFCFLAEDISEWKDNAEKAIRDQERLHVALEAGRLAFWDWDLVTGVMHYGGEWTKLFGYPEGKLSPSFAEWHSLLHPEDAGRVMEAIQANLDGRTPEFEAEYRMKAFSGEWLWVTSRGRVIERDANQKPVRHVGVIEDIHEGRNTREQLRQVAQQKDEFLATLAHELRNPLAPIRTGLEIIKRDPSGLMAQQARDMMDRQLSHLVRLIDDLLDVSRISLGRLELRKSHLEVRTIIDTAVEGSKPFVESRKHSLTVSIPDEPIFIFGDLTRLAQVVSNLINNSCKYTPEGGHIQVRISRLPNLVSIQVQDDGLGIPPEMLDKIFEMFGQVNRTLDRAQGGLGIGLALVRKLVELHGGTVQAESPGINRGATFTITLPQDPEAEVPVPKPLDEPATPIQSRRILVIDDNVDAAESLSMFLQLSGHTTKVAYSPSVGLKLAQEFKPDMVFLDIGLPEMTGYEVARRIRSSPIGKSTCLIAVTGWGAEKDRDAAKEAGFNAHITKPVDLDEVARLLEHGTADHAFDV